MATPTSRLEISMNRMLSLGAAMSLLLMLPACAGESAPIAVTLKNHLFTPSEIHVKANTPFVIALTNDDDTADEFDSSSMKVEKVVAGHSSGNVRIRPLAPGRYPFMGEYHSDTAQGVVVAE